MLIAELSTEGIMAVATVIGAIAGGLIEYLRRQWVAINKDRRDAANADQEAEFNRRKAEFGLIQIPTERLIAQLQEEVKILRGELTAIQTKSLEKILESVNREAECQRKHAALEQVVKNQENHICDLQARIVALEGK